MMKNNNYCVIMAGGLAEIPDPNNSWISSGLGAVSSK